MGFVGLLSLLVDHCSSKLAVPCSVAGFQTVRVYIDGDAILYHLCKSLKRNDNAQIIGDEFVKLVKRDIESCLLTMPQACAVKVKIAFDGRAGSLKLQTLQKRRAKAALTAKHGINTLTDQFRLNLTLRHETKQWIVGNQKTLIDHFALMDIETSLSFSLWSDDGEAESKLMHQLTMDLARSDYDKNTEFCYFMTTDTDMIVLTLLALEQHTKSVFYVRLFSERSNDPCFEMSLILAMLKKYALRSMLAWTIALLALGNDYLDSEIEYNKRSDCFQWLGNALMDCPSRTLDFKLYEFVVKSVSGKDTNCSEDHFTRVLNYYIDTSRSANITKAVS
ncbi:hypothetical protein HDE_12927 [Halotydeus destructor]|nr:hypothetical protein HDE_12927 [Halotydeus destructor]